VRRLALAAMLLAGCGDNLPMTLRDHVREFAAAAEERDVACGRDAKGEAKRLESLLCPPDRRCDEAPACEPSTGECVDALLSMGCADNTFPSACFDLWPSFGCLKGGWQTPPSTHTKFSTAVKPGVRQVV
jgi:hypothetical protein